MQKKAPAINLLRAQRSNFFDRFFTWALTVGRVLVIIVELVAFSAFVYRFSLDRQLIDLHSKIKQEQAVVAFLKDGEEKYRNLQDRLDIANNFSTIGAKKAKVLSDMIQFAPSGIIFNNITIFEDRARIIANVDSVSSLSNFVESLKSYSITDSVSIDKIENRPSSSQITISMTVTFKPEKNKYEDVK